MLFDSYKDLVPQKQNIYEAYSLLQNCYKKSGLVMVCGNGGSASDSEHIVGELMKGFNLKREIPSEKAALFDNIENGHYIASHLQSPLSAVSLVSQTSLITAYANDVAPDLVFAQQVFGYAKNPFDVLIALSTSGNSTNIVNAVKTAKALGIKSISITGELESTLSSISDVCIQLPKRTPFEVQELTLPLYHTLCAMLEAEFFGV